MMLALAAAVAAGAIGGVVGTLLVLLALAMVADAGAPQLGPEWDRGDDPERDPGYDQVRHMFNEDGGRS